MTTLSVDLVAETNAHKVFKCVLVTEDGEATVTGFGETKLNPDKTLLIETENGDFHIEKGHLLGVYMDQVPGD